MLSDIPKLFDKNFAIGYLIPSLGLLLGIQGLLSAFGIASLPGFLTETNLVIGSAIVALLGWLVGVVLAATNRDIIRFLEGYGDYNPLWVLLPLQKKYFNDLEVMIVELEDKHPHRTEKEEDRLNELFQEQVTNLPDKEKWLLPTSFGNAIRAFEVYPRLMYGVDSIALWPRMLAVIPAEYKAHINDAKAHMDFWINLVVSTLLLLLSSLMMRIYSYYNQIAVNDLLFWLLIAVEVLLIALFQYRAKRSAIGWGQTVKSAFDLYLPDLAARIGLKVPDTREGQKKMWENYGIAILYARQDLMPELAKPGNGTEDSAREGILSRIIKLLFGG